MFSNISGCGILPIAKSNNKIYFLLGKEQIFKGWSGSNKFCDFGGKIENNENVLDCAAREGYEETLGLLGSLSDIRKMVSPDSEQFIDVFMTPKKNEHFIVAIKIYYNKYLPKMYNDVFEYFTKCADKTDDGKFIIKSCPNGFFEKSEIKWFSYDELKKLVENNRKDILRPFFIRCMKMLFHKYKNENDMLHN